MDTIANHLGLSRNAVWLALHGKPGVSEETRQRVESLAQSLGYRRPGKASEEAGPNGTVGLVLSEDIFHETSFFGPMIMHMQRHVAKLGSSLIIQAVSHEDELAVRMPTTVASGTVSGVMVLSRLASPLIEAIAANVPTILVDHYDPLLTVDRVGTANRQGAYRAVHHLVSLDHRAIGFIGGGTQVPSYRERWIGFQEAAEDLGLNPAEEWVWMRGEESDDGMLKFLAGRRHHQPTAWFCVNDALAFHLVRALYALDVAVPDQCSVVGFDNQAFAKMSHPPLTTLNIDREQFAAAAVRQLFDRIQFPSRPVRSVTLTPDLIVGRSTSRAIHQVIIDNKI